MNFSSSVLNLAATVVSMGVSFAIAADKQPSTEPITQPEPRQVDQKEVEAGRVAAQADIGKKLIRYDIVG